MRGDPILGWNKDKIKILLTGPLFGAIPEDIAKSSLKDEEGNIIMSDEQHQASLS